MIRIYIIVFWVETLCSDAIKYHISEGHIASIFRMKAAQHPTQMTIT